MHLFEVFLIALSMAMDAFAVCLGAGTSAQTSGPRPTFRLSFHFGLFQFIMPVIGWLAGTTIVNYIADYDHWVAFGLLAFVGIRMIRSGFDSSNESHKNDPSRGWSLILLSIAVSIDALAIGLSLALIGVTIWYPAVVIGVVTGLVSWLGLRLGNVLGGKFGKRMEIAGGIVLILIGARIVLSHLLA
ncbi:MAG: manganese efflux pump MntP family protein [Anaerolineales bacterium]|nr:manganese efflux pump MntP family protein [Anaerolineales bacterium]MDP2976675.1 manganese efflux pump MntP family protein [Anaerolineales bacterium]